MKFLCMLVVLTAQVTLLEARSSGAGTCTAQQATIDGMGGISYPTNQRVITFTGTSGAVTEYTPAGPALTVSITGGPDFKGFLIYAETAGGTRVGTWSGAGGHACDGVNSYEWTHSDAGFKGVPLALSWTPPAVGAGTLTFRGATMANGQCHIFGTETLTEAAAPQASSTAPSSTAAPAATTSTGGQAVTSSSTGGTPAVTPTPTATSTAAGTNTGTNTGPRSSSSSSSSTGNNNRNSAASASPAVALWLALSGILAALAL